MMTLAQLHQLACEAGIQNFGSQTPKAVLIRKIQTLRGSEACFATEKSHECAEICQWRRDCRKLKAAWLR